MKTMAKIISLASLIVLCIPVILYLMGNMKLDTVKTVMSVATVAWFITASMWMWKSDASQTGS